MFGTKKKLHKSVRYPLEQGDHPELETSDILDNEDTHKYKYLIGYLQWDISLGIFYIFTHVMKVSIFRSSPRQGCMDQANWIYAYMDKMINACIRVWKEDTDYSELPDQKFY